jgi:hypothetical protein
MSTKTPESERSTAGGTGLLLLVSFATILTVAAESAFIHWASWTLLVGVLALIVVFAILITGAVGRLIDDGEILPHARTSPPRTAEPQREPAPVATRPAGGRPALGH